MSSRGQEDELSDTADGSGDTEPLLPVEHLKDKDHVIQIESRSSPHRTPLEDVPLVHIPRAGTSNHGEIDELMLEPPQCRICLDSEGKVEDTICVALCIPISVGVWFLGDHCRVVEKSLWVQEPNLFRSNFDHYV